jgi:hypothetical protein
MARRTKTVEIPIGVLATMANNTATDFPSISLTIPEWGVGAGVVFKFAKLHLSANEGAGSTAAGTYSSRMTRINIGGAGANTVNETQTLTNSGEHLSANWWRDVTARFVADFTSGTRTIVVGCQLNSNGTGANFVDVTATLILTYEFDTAAPTQLVSHRIPLATPNGALATSKPGTPHTTFPALDTYCPEASKTFRFAVILIEANNAAGTADTTLSMQLDSLTAYTSGTLEKALNSDRFIRLMWSVLSIITTSTAHNFFMWASATGYHHPTATALVVYEFDATASTRFLRSARLPQQMTSPVSDVTNATTVTRSLRIAEANPTLSRHAFYLYWDQSSSMAATLRAGLTDFTDIQSFTDNAAALCGGNTLMVRRDDLTLVQGANTLAFVVYLTAITNQPYNLSGYHLINYTADKPAQGYAVGLCEQVWGCYTPSNVAAGTRYEDATSPMPTWADDYYIVAVGTHLSYLSNSTSNPSGLTVQCRLAEWEDIYTDISRTSPEVGLRQCFSQARDLFRRFDGDVGAGRSLFSGISKWRVAFAGGATAFFSLDLIVVDHGITFTVSGNVTGSAGGTVTLHLVRAATGERLKTTTRTGNGAFSFTWYDPTELLYVDAYETGVLLGRSDADYAV